jgi:hypothetical protein
MFQGDVKGILPLLWPTYLSPLDTNSTLPAGSTINIPSLAPLTSTVRSNDSKPHLVLDYTVDDLTRDFVQVALTCASEISRSD